MCTAVSFSSKFHVFGRNLDLDRSYGESVVITPRKYEFKMRHVSNLTSHYALIGMATVVDGVPLYYEATNEKGVSIAGLNFPGNASYKKPIQGKDNIAPFELIPWILGQVCSVREALKLLENINIIDVSFSEHILSTPLHWLMADATQSVTIECVSEGLKIYDNPWGVLTNNPTFDYHLLNMHPYMHLYEGESTNTLNPDVSLDNYSLGFGALGLPGDYSSTSRFVRACYVKSKSVCADTQEDTVNQFFHIMNSVAMPKGCVLCPNGEFEYTRYSCCCTDQGVYTYTTYDNSSKTSIDLHSVNLDESLITSFPID